MLGASGQVKRETGHEAKAPHTIDSGADYRLVQPSSSAAVRAFNEYRFSRARFGD
jgi:hypothetical protein